MTRPETAPDAAPVPDPSADVVAGDARTRLFAGTIRRLLSPVGEFLSDPAVSEIMINGPNEIWVERRETIRFDDGTRKDRAVLRRVEGRAFASVDDLEAAARAIAQFSGKHLSRDELSVEARLHDKSRVHILMPPAARNGLCIAIRRFGKASQSIPQLIANGSLQPDVALFLRVCLGLKKNVVVSGGTSTGKTTILNALSEFMDGDDRVIVIEDVNELEIKPAHTLYFEAQKPDAFGRGGITIRDLFKASLRMRPDRIVVGECRGGEALDMIQAMTSGHSGSMTTLHADTPLDALNRLETMALMSGLELPQRALRAQICSAVDVIVQLQRIGGRRAVVEVAEVGDLGASGHYELHSIFERTDAVYDLDGDAAFTRPTGARVRFHRDAAAWARAHGLERVAGIDPFDGGEG
ncbi:CpaF family protein [Pinisolibacter aquiterrae]|uniref:CpaF family protein n=1 Tax=Pinisolibacter aquiterrae TaxID=2815579 RepID=UPI001C3D3B5C|nr:ATPase, T2SS/T4P/T4SS family [Pinisolibacter aquiterrae]MBV5266591.1 CpaF family protein [Pinisolibacter aquiterrae]MCC8234636.1 Flp pilus assembly complex ATPase component TadA [Pinisolibacter aquiterrae]